MLPMEPSKIFSNSIMKKEERKIARAYCFLGKKRAPTTGRRVIRMLMMTVILEEANVTSMDFSEDWYF